MALSVLSTSVSASKFTSSALSGAAAVPAVPLDLDLTLVFGAAFLAAAFGLAADLAEAFGLALAFFPFLKSQCGSHLTLLNSLYRHRHPPTLARLSCTSTPRRFAIIAVFGLVRFRFLSACNICIFALAGPIGEFSSVAAIS